ncbi:MAG TPA: amino acid ABC transporter substrate-binding protein, partial [Ramlibacter sp.]|nr:amino acid ABC transporter substrate-binding protein [Ramlibacter sp.]
MNLRSCLGTFARFASIATIAFAAHAAPPIKIGAFLSVTGGASFLGDPEQKTLELYVDKINAAGGVL